MIKISIQNKSSSDDSSIIPKMTPIASSSTEIHMNSPIAPLLSANIALNQTKMITLGPVNKKLVKSSAAIETDDLLLQILSRLPIDSIQRFRIACKQWCSLVTDPTFRKLWRKHNLHPPTALILFTTSPMSIHFLPFSSNAPSTPPNLKTQIKIMQSCNGLLLCSSKKHYHVYNPIMDMCHTLPKLGRSIVRAGTRIHSMNLAFDPNKFGQHYKVICCVTLEKSKRGLHVHIYSSDTRVWKSIFNLVYTDNVNKEKGVYWNGSIHWRNELTYFNIENETFNVMPRLPPGTHKWHYFFGESCDRLNCAQLFISREGASKFVDVYELERDYSKWVLKYHVKLDCLPLITSVVSVVCGIEDEDSFLVLESEKGLIRCNLVSKISEVMPISFTHRATVRVFQYIESQYRV